MQLWFGGFIHGVMEESYLLWRDGGEKFKQFPWTYEDCLEIQKTVDRTRLRPLNLIAPSNQFSRDVAERKVANIRAYEAVNGWGPHLFPLISNPEVPLHGVRPMPVSEGEARSSLYEVSGVVDILASANFLSSRPENTLVGMIRDLMPNVEGDFEIIVDYKGSDRPRLTSSQGRDYMQKWEWQLQTYGWLRSRQKESLPVRAGVLLFLNEMYPSRFVLERLAKQAALGQRIEGATERDLHLLRNYREGYRPRLSLEFRMHRSVQVLPFAPEVIEAGSSRFDQTVALIEEAVLREMSGDPLPTAWAESWKRLPTADGSPREAPELQTCTACDHRTYCRLALETHSAEAVGTVPPANEE